MDQPPTIFAPASGFGRAAVAVIRISGPASASVLIRLSGSLPAPRRLVLRTLQAPQVQETLDQALVVWMPGPGTFTGEDMAELHLHGGPAVRAAVLGALAALPGCIPAEPGAFTRRAFLNGRLGLTEAEGIADLIDAETEAQRRQALRQLDGALGRRVAAWRDRLIDLLAGVEAALDFSDEGDVDDDALDAALFAKARVIRDAIAAALDDGGRGERLRDGFTVVLAGPPNAGKSTLLNALSRRDAAIVSPVPGTTRDVIEVRCDLGGLPVLLIDTAGLREAGDALEAEGIRRTRARIAQADLVLLLAEAGSTSDMTDLSVPMPPVLRVQTKADLSEGSRSAEGHVISAMTGEGLDTLLDAIEHHASVSIGGEAALITRQRHREGLTRCRDHLDRLVQGAVLPELAAEDLRLAVRALGEVAGQVGVEEMLDRLFSGFCIGK
ncbi:tRNA uridine-5-carboxymethylaminomethyl(34) synthesis GTPase MnmE [Methylobacterium sp. Leaf100]|uniref:tRNA uridine-5-carboxymethylaminomethyl(34) synthesis GTPase MnmE n=1 Tax=Methylobacterium sp. Leaf100 TaxID=1736252 RepID=UPI0006FF3EA1|nr:tRNA uridine-5-carboxymethylaminomethyl(34) synthesis GTPase MnmE [Methylobacterium sp. Leaf100]KQP20188.1 tRNA modification GTPase MnmE [Methylobacterium sp. Leaf100]USU33974.1 tRNA uridine-5-carboxymethylaminomethyl(34) synthesis GTPase MnmE [Methylobacterium sp. OTU13CASTA1]